MLDKILYLTFGLTVLFLTTGLNDYLSEITGTTGLISSVILFFLVTVIILANLAGTPLVNDRPAIVVFLAFGGFQLLAALASMLNQDPDSLFWGIRYYFPSLLVYIFGLFACSHVIRHKSAGSLVSVLWFSLMFSSITILVSILDVEGIIFIPSDGRYSGFNLNANRAGYIGSLALCVGFSTRKFERNQWGRLMLICVVASIFATFSKTAYLMGLVTLLFFIYRKTVSQHRMNLGKLIIIPGTVLAVIGYVLFATDDQLTSNQIERVGELGSFLSGQVNDDTTTNRKSLALAGVLRISEAPLMGSGFRTMSAMSENVSGGVHNHFLLLWGEGGISALILYLVMIIVLYKRTGDCSNSIKLLVRSILLVTFMYSLACHNIYSDKLFMIVMALIVVLLNHNQNVRDIRTPRNW